jgi:transposase
MTGTCDWCREHVTQRLLPAGAATRPAADLVGGGKGVLGMEVVIERCAGLDVGKADLKACVRVPGPRGGRRQQIKTFATTAGSLLRLRDWLAEQGVTVVGMEATGVYWKPVYYVLEDTAEVQLLNAAHMHNVPGRKTDVSDSAWIAQLVEHGLVRASFVPPRPIRRLRDLTRYRAALTAERTREKQRLEKLLEDAQLTELRRRIAVSGRQSGTWVATFPAHDQRRGWREGPVVVEGAALRSA